MTHAEALPRVTRPASRRAQSREAWETSRRGRSWARLNLPTRSRENRRAWPDRTGHSRAHQGVGAATSTMIARQVARGTRKAVAEVRTRGRGPRLANPRRPARAKTQLLVPRPASRDRWTHRLTARSRATLDPDTGDPRIQHESTRGEKGYPTGDLPQPAAGGGGAGALETARGGASGGPFLRVILRERIFAVRAVRVPRWRGWRRAFFLRGFARRPNC